MAPSHTVALVITALLVLGYAVDAADGQLARARGTSSPSGEWLDHMVDAAKVCLLHSAVLVSFYRFPRAESDFWLLVPLGYTTIASVFFFGFILTDQLRRRIGTAPAGPGVTEDAVTMRSGLLQTVVATPSDYGLLCLAFALYGWPLGFLAAYTALCAANGVLLIAVLGRWHRQLRAADAGTRVGA
jgi:phosphatidylglycerophosphate synthase